MGFLLIYYYFYFTFKDYFLTNNNPTFNSFIRLFVIDSLPLLAYLISTPMLSVSNFLEKC